MQHGQALGNDWAPPLSPLAGTGAGGAAATGRPSAPPRTRRRGCRNRQPPGPQVRAVLSALPINPKPLTPLNGSVCPRNPSLSSRRQRSRWVPPLGLDSHCGAVFPLARHGQGLSPALVLTRRCRRMAAQLLRAARTPHTGTRQGRGGVTVAEVSRLDAARGHGGSAAVARTTRCAPNPRMRGFLDE